MFYRLRRNLITFCYSCISSTTKNHFCERDSQSVLLCLFVGKTCRKFLRAYKFWLCWPHNLKWNKNAYVKPLILNNFKSFKWLYLAIYISINVFGHITYFMNVKVDLNIFFESINCAQIFYPDLWIGNLTAQLNLFHTHTFNERTTGNQSLKIWCRLVQGVDRKNRSLAITCFWKTIR